MATVIRTSLEYILLNLQARIMAITGFDESRVIIDSEVEFGDEEVHYQAEQIVFVRSGDARPEPGFEGMGRVWTAERTPITAVLWTRNALDAQPGFESGLTDPVLGHEPWKAMLKNALYAWQPMDANLNWLVQQPIQPAGTTGPSRRKKNDYSWARSTVKVYATFGIELDQTYQ